MYSRSCNEIMIHRDVETTSIEKRGLALLAVKGKNPPGEMGGGKILGGQCV